jgi:acetylornithine deacetylase
MPSIPATDEMLESLIASPSVSSTHSHLDTSNLAVVNLLANWLDQIGFEVKIQTVSDHKANMIARIGDGDDGLVLSGHTDTVPYDDSLWLSDPFACTKKDDRLYGLGTSDMKSFFALAIAALQDINLDKLTRPLTILATADEESTMAGAKALLEDRHKLGQYCVIGEPTNLIPVRQHKGIFMESIRLTGQSGHSSDPSLGNSALEGMHEIVQAILNFRDRLGTQFVNHDFAVPLPTLNLGHIHGGDNANRICGACELHYDLRLLPEMELNQIRNALRDLIKDIANRRNLACEFSSLFDGTPALSTPAGSEIVKMTEELTRSTSQSVVFATEGPYFSQLGMETVVLGPGSIEVAHQPNEFIEIEQLQQAINIYSALVQKICIQR